MLSLNSLNTLREYIENHPSRRHLGSISSQSKKRYAFGLGVKQFVRDKHKQNKQPTNEKGRNKLWCSTCTSFTTEECRPNWLYHCKYCLEYVRSTTCCIVTYIYGLTSLLWLPVLYFNGIVDVDRDVHSFVVDFLSKNYRKSISNTAVLERNMVQSLRKKFLAW